MNRTESAINFICSDDRDVWIMVGMALQAEYGDAARDLWMNWSRQSDSFKEADARAVWRSFRGTGVGIASLYHEAKQNGWKDEAYQKPTAAQVAEQRRIAAERHTQEGKERAIAARKAAEKAKWILSQCKHEKHAYLHAKGFQELHGLVWYPTETQNLLCIPMHIGGEVVGLQMIDRDGAKKYLSGSTTSKAEFVFDSRAMNAVDFFCEGYATGLSLQACLTALKTRYRIHIAFSAGNLTRTAHSGYVIADHDKSGAGEKAAVATGLPFWISDIEGEDFNDAHQRLGLFRCSQMLGKWLRETKDKAKISEPAECYQHFAGSKQTCYGGTHHA